MDQGHMQKLRGKVLMVHTSQYADDTTIFVALNKKDIDFLDSTLKFQ
jgi:hypothetical protein